MLSEAGMDVYPVTDLEAFFVGQWRLERDILDTAGTQIGSFAGSAWFTSDAGGLSYLERGQLDMGSHRAPAYRCSRYRIIGPGQAWVYFDDGDFFHELDLRGGWWRTRHPCRDDLYRGEFHVFAPHWWRQVWTVAGPTKNHTLVSQFERVEADQKQVAGQAEGV